MVDRGTDDTLNAHQLDASARQEKAPAISLQGSPPERVYVGCDEGAGPVRIYSPQATDRLQDGPFEPVDTVSRLGPRQCLRLKRLWGQAQQGLADVRARKGDRRVTSVARFNPCPRTECSDA